MAVHKSLAKLIADDAHAATFQSLAQYRAALLEHAWQQPEWADIPFADLPAALVPTKPDLDYLGSMAANPLLPAQLRGQIASAMQRLADHVEVERLREEISALKAAAMGIRDAWREDQLKLAERDALLRVLDEEWNSHDGRLRFQAAMLKIEALLSASAEPACPWIKCTDRLPGEDGPFWCWHGLEKPSVVQQRVCIFIHRQGVFADGSVTHWMPLPDAPAKGSDGQVQS